DRFIRLGHWLGECPVGSGAGFPAPARDRTAHPRFRAVRDVSSTRNTTSLERPEPPEGSQLEHEEAHRGGQTSEPRPVVRSAIMDQTKAAEIENLRTQLQDRLRRGEHQNQRLPLLRELRAKRIAAIDASDLRWLTLDLKLGKRTGPAEFTVQVC